MVKIVQDNEGAAPKVIIAKFCMNVGLSKDKGQEFFQVLRDSGHIEVNDGCVFIKAKIEEPATEEKKQPELTGEENKILDAKPEKPEANDAPQL